VITHTLGTDTLKEIAYFLNLVVHSDEPMVVVGSAAPHRDVGRRHAERSIPTLREHAQLLSSRRRSCSRLTN